MRVKAIRMGYYGLRRIRVDDIFTLKKDSDFSSKWMEVVEDSPRGGIKGAKKSGLKMPGHEGDVALIDQDSN
jgi:hypothetical protein